MIPTDHPGWMTHFDRGTFSAGGHATLLHSVNSSANSVAGFHCNPFLRFCNLSRST
jgi:hypothetical protein